MNVTQIRCWLLIVVALFVGCLCGIWLGSQMFTVRIMVDYNSGNVNRLMSVGPILVRSEPEPLQFFDRAGVSTNISYRPVEWHTALLFRGPFSYNSPNIQPSGEVLRSLRLLNDLFSNMDIDEARSIKNVYLTILSSNAVCAVNYVDAILHEMN